MGLFNFFKKEKTDVEQYYEERAKREDVNGTADPYSDFRITVEDVFTITGRGDSYHRQGGVGKNCGWR